MARIEWLDGLRLRVTFADTHTTVIDVATELHEAGKLHELTHDVERNLPLRIDRKTGKYQGVDTFHYPESGPCFYGVVRKAPVHAQHMDSAHDAAVARARDMDETKAERRRSKRPANDADADDADADDDPVVTGVTTWEQRDQECRACAVVLE
jgi:hypothetical protein